MEKEIMKTDLSTLSFVANLKDGVITSNLEELSLAAKQKVAEYKEKDYGNDDTSSIKLMKGDRADLNKIVKAMDEKRKSIKTEYMKNFDVFEEEVKKASGIIKDQANELDVVIKNAENAAKEKKKAEIRSFYDSISSIVPEDFREKLYSKIYDCTWENATATKKAYKEGITNSVQSYVNARNTLDVMESEYFKEGLEVLNNTLDLSLAIAKVKELERKKEEILERERKRLEAEAAAKAEAEARKKLEAERQALAAAQQLKLQKEKEEQEKNAVISTSISKSEEAYIDATSERERVAESIFAPETNKTHISNVNVSGDMVKVAKGCKNVSFNEIAWEEVKAFCDENGIGYIENN